MPRKTTYKPPETGPDGRAVPAKKPPSLIDRLRKELKPTGLLVDLSGKAPLKVPTDLIDESLNELQMNLMLNRVLGTKANKLELLALLVLLHAADIDPKSLGQAS